MDELKPNAQNVEDSGLELPKPEPTSEEKRSELAKTLHTGGILPRLRTFQGDVAQFIKAKDESLADVVLKEKERQQLTADIEVKKPTSQSNPLIYLVGLVLIVGAVGVLGYTVVLKLQQAPVEITTERKLIPVKETVTQNLAIISLGTLSQNLAILRENNEQQGVTGIKISGSTGREVTLPQEFVTSLGLGAPSPLIRNMGEVMEIGLYQGMDFFFVFKIKDFGIAYSSMLEWEKSLLGNFESLLKPESDTTRSEYFFKDLIVRNKDTRAAVSNNGRVRIIYTFLDKETVLITESEAAIRGLLDAYVAGNTVK